MTPPSTQLPPVGSRVIVQYDGQPKQETVGTVKRHVGGWLAEVEIPGKKEPGLYAPEGMRQAK